MATGLPLIGTGFTLKNMEVLKSVPLLLHFFQAYSHFMYTAMIKDPFKKWDRGVKGVYTAMVKDPFKKWDRVDTFCALLVNLGLFRHSHCLLAPPNAEHFVGLVLIWQALEICSV